MIRIFFYRLSDRASDYSKTCNYNIHSGFTDGSPVRITLAQNESEVTVFEGTTSFPYLMNVRGQDGVASGTAYVYMLDASGNVLSTTKYDGIAFYPQG